MLTGVVIQGSGRESEGWVKSFYMSFTLDTVSPFIWNTYVKRIDVDDHMTVSWK